MAIQCIPLPSIIRKRSVCLINIFIITHAGIAESIINGIELIMGDVAGLSALGYKGGDGFQAFNRNINSELETIYCEDGVLMLVDLFGGTPSNVSAMGIRRGLDSNMPNIECISGVNMPMVIEAVTKRESMTLAELKEHCIAAGKSGIKDIRAEFKM